MNRSSKIMFEEYSEARKPLKLYKKVLIDIANFNYEYKGTKKATAQAENLILRPLKEEGLIYFDEIEDGRTLVTLTPKGAKTLIEWDNYIRHNSWWYIILLNISKAFWIILGAVLASLPNIIHFFVN